MARKNARRKRRRALKVRHKSRGAAQAALKSLKRNNPHVANIGVYRCGKHWHVGHRSRSAAQRIWRAIRYRKGY